MDERLYQVEQEKQNAINQSNNVYNELLSDNQTQYNQSNEFANQQETIQNNILDKQLNFQRQEIEKQKQEAQQVYQDESKRSKNDYLAFNNQYNVQNEQMASSGLLNSGLSETTKLGGFNAYQNRLATANKAMQDAFTQFDSDLNEAIMNNDVQKAQNALAKLQLQQQYLDTYYSNKSSLSQNQLSNNQALDSEYFNRYQTEYGNIQAEKERQEAIRQWEAEFAEQQRQYNEQMAYQREQDAIAQANWEKEYNLAKSSSSAYSLSDTSTLSNNTTGNTIAGAAIGSVLGSALFSSATNPQTGTINEDTQYGTFSNGYQPNNVGGVKLQKSGSTTTVNGKTQNIWVLDDGSDCKLVVWDGNQNQYVLYKGTLASTAMKNYLDTKK